jgi:hypothetical protein
VCDGLIYVADGVEGMAILKFTPPEGVGAEGGF